MNSRKCTKPIRMWIDGFCYEITKANKSFSRKNMRRFDSDDIKQNNMKSREFSAQFHLPLFYYSKLNELRQQVDEVERETSTVISYPIEGKEGLLEITGESEESLRIGREKLFPIIAGIREHASALQFIGIPLLSDEIKSNFEKFKATLLAEDHQGVEESIFQKSSKLHLTIVVFTLLDEKEKTEAIRVLIECKSMLSRLKENNSEPLKIEISGLNIMNNDLSKVHVLYANAKLSEDLNPSLQEMANSIAELFNQKGLVRSHQDSVKLHMSLINTKYRKRNEADSRRRWTKREPINATDIFEKYKNYYFGEVVFDTVHLSLISTTGDDGFYSSLASIKF